MAKIVTMKESKHVLLPFPETRLNVDFPLTIQSMDPRDHGVVVVGLIVSEECRPHVRIKMGRLTSERFIAAALVERLALRERLELGFMFPVEVEATANGVLFVAALKCVQSFPVEES